ncbi:TldD/PmbA family protein [Candidatus Micrarchaeota archaeon]|nr:TldD/PmbA family protein [Candidatus Micrarchaeota archaeon]
MEKFVKLAEKLGADEAEIYLNESTDLSYSSRKDELYSKEFDSKRGYGVRVVKDRRIGFSYFIQENDAERAIKIALGLSKFSEGSEFGFQKKQAYGKVDAYDKKVAELSEEEGKDRIMGIVERIKEMAKPTEIFLSFSTDSSEIMNSNGLHATERFTGISCFVEACYEESVAQVGYGSINLDKELEEKCVEVGRIAKEMNKAKTIETSKKIVVFDQQVVHSILMLLIHSFNGERIRRGASLLYDKLGEKIGWEKLSLFDDPYADATGKSGFDGEGTAGKTKELVKDGYLRNFIFDRKTLALYGKQDQEGIADGNCVRGGYASTPVPGHSNLVVGEGEVENLVSEVKEGIYLKSFFGEHTANELTGDFSVSVDIAFRIKNGEINEPVRNFVLSGNVFTILNQIVGIEKKQEKYFDIVSPKIAFKDMQLVG